MSDLLRLILVCVLMVILLRRQLNLGLVMAGAAILLALIYGLGPYALLSVAWRTLTASDSINLVLALIFIAFLEHAMRHAGMMERMVGALRDLIHDPRIIMAALPAFLGFLPSAGGARFSCPLVDQVTRDFEIPPERKAFINYWYRHLWECVMPIYPSLIVTTQVLGLNMDRLLVATVPMTPIIILAGLIPAFKGISGQQNSIQNMVHHQGQDSQDQDPRDQDPRDGRGEVGDVSSVLPKTMPVSANRSKDILDAAYSLSPVIGILLGVMVLKLSVALAVAIVLIIMIIWGRYTVTDVTKLLKEGFSLNIVLLVYGVMFFRDVMVRSGALERISPALTATGIPPLVILFALPFLVGFSTGLAVSVPGVAFPLIAGIIGIGGNANLALATFAFVSGYVGTMLSPAHLCLVLSIDYFKARFSKVQNMLWCPAGIVQAGALLLTMFRLRF
ncbi:MAG TPA: DUF401 family protein [Firmicutes bacterium]|nr:DUF401 family protein [Bacillota bacterium]